jgi:membrane protein YqaA with SNARE-associated domain
MSLNKTYSMDFASLVSEFLSWAGSMASAFGYFGILIISFVASASIFLPIPAFLLVFGFGSILNPLLVGLFAALGAAFGELTSYGIGIGGRKAIEKKYRKFLKKYGKWLRNRNFFLVVVVFAATPLPYDLIGIIGGIFKYDLKKFLIATFLGKLVMNTVIALAGYYGIRAILTIFGG